MDIRARVSCVTVIQSGAPRGDKIGAINGGVSMEQVTFQAIYGNSDEDPNRSYSAATPYMKIEMTVTNKDAWGAFVPGHIYDVTFSPTPPRAEEPFVKG